MPRKQGKEQFAKAFQNSECFWVRARGVVTILNVFLCVFSAVAAGYCLKVSRAAQSVVTAAHGPPILSAEVDFSEPFTNQFTFRHTAEPLYGTMYLMLETDPLPKDWTDSEVASEQLKSARGKMRVLSRGGALVDESGLNWFYGRIPQQPTGQAPLQGFFGRLPPGEYRLEIATAYAVPQLKGSKQKLVLRYDYIHERPIARFLRNVSVALFVIAGVSGAFFVRHFKAVGAKNSGKP